MSKRICRILIVGSVLIGLVLVYVRYSSQRVDHVYALNLLGHTDTFSGMSSRDCGPEAATTPPPSPADTDPMVREPSRAALLESLWAIVYSEEHPVRMKQCAGWNDEARNEALVVLVIGIGSAVINERRKVPIASHPPR